MYRLLQLLKRYYPLLLFVGLEILAINYYAKSTSYSRAKVITASNRVVSGVHGIFSSIGDWFSLGRENRMLLDRLAKAETQLSAYREAAAGYDTQDIPESKYFFSYAKVINGTVNRKENFFIIDKGVKDGVERNMSVISVDGTVVGYVEEPSNNFSVCMSILNRDFRIGGRVKNKDYIGSVFWEGNSADMVTLSEIPKYAALEKGDTIVSAYSSRFPPDIFIGTVNELHDSPDGVSYWVDVLLGTDISKLSDVMLVRYTDSQELQSLEDQYLGTDTNRQNR